MRPYPGDDPYFGDEPDDPLDGLRRPTGPLTRFTRRHGRKLWWLHSMYALALGVFIVMFAQRGYAYVRWLLVLMAVAWFLIVAFFRAFGTGEQQKVLGRGRKLHFLVMTYVLKNLYQGMLWFLLPFYWRSATLDAPNRWFVLALAACGVLATLDIVFDRWLMRWRVVASIYYVATLFACLNLAIPALLPGARTLFALLAAAGISTGAFWLLHFSPRLLREPAHGVRLAVTIAMAMGAVYLARPYIPPVPLRVGHGAVGHRLLEDGRLALEVTSLHYSLITEMVAVTDVVSPGGTEEPFQHVWRREGEVVLKLSPMTHAIEGKVPGQRLRSELHAEQLPAVLVGRWSVDVLTDAGQLVGRTRFEVTE